MLATDNVQGPRGGLTRVALLAIASHAPAYDEMKACALAHLEQAAGAPGLAVEPWFLYGATAAAGSGSDTKGKGSLHELDAVYPDVEESLVPGVLLKTVAALREVTDNDADDDDAPDFVIRTNLSTWFHWDKLAAFLAGAPRSRFAAGYSPDKSHLCGCCMVLSADVARQLAQYDAYDVSAIDDLALSEALGRLGVPVRWIPRIDILKSHIEGLGNEEGLDPLDAFHYRVKSCVGGDADRCAQDPTVLRALTDAYAAGERDPDALLRKCVERVRAASSVG